MVSSHSLFEVICEKQSQDQNSKEGSNFDPRQQSSTASGLMMLHVPTHTSSLDGHVASDLWVSALKLVSAGPQQGRGEGRCVPVSFFTGHRRAAMAPHPSSETHSQTLPSGILPLARGHGFGHELLMNFQIITTGCKCPTCHLRECI